MTTVPRLQLPTGAIVLLTGPSGSGKSQLLTRIRTAFSEPQDLCEDAHLTDDRPIIDWWDDVHNAIHTLSMVGLADAFTWARTWWELSVGQQQRLRLALAILSGGTLLIEDEYLAGLDSITAQAVSWAVQKMLRRTGCGAIFATARQDLLEYVRPDVHIETNWTPDPQVTRIGWDDSGCPLLDQMTYERGDRLDWLALKPLHYAAGDPATLKSIDILRHPNIPGPAAVAVCSYPDLHSSARNIATCDDYLIKGSRAVAKRLNQEVARLSRVVVTPELRSIGMASALLEAMLPTMSIRWLEASTAMGRYSGFLQRMGFREVPNTSGDADAQLQDWSTQQRIPPQVALDGRALMEHVEGLSVRQRRQGRQIIWKHYHQFVLHRRTRSRKVGNVPGPDNEHWPEAFELAARRMQERPSYWILGPLGGHAEDRMASRSSAVHPPSKRHDRGTTAARSGESEQLGDREGKTTSPVGQDDTGSPDVRQDGPH